MWIGFAFASAFFAGVTSILAKCGIKQTDSNVATAIRTMIVLAFSWIMVLLSGSLDGAEGSASLENLLTRIKLELIKAGVIGGQFLLRPPLETFIYPDSEPPIFLGEMMTRFKLPAMESEVMRIWH